MFAEVLRSLAQSQSSEIPLTVVMVPMMKVIKSSAKPLAALSCYGFPRKSALLGKKAIEQRVLDFRCEDGENFRSCSVDCRFRKESGYFGETVDFNTFRETLCRKKVVERCLVWVAQGLVGAVKNQEFWGESES